MREITPKRLRILRAVQNLWVASGAMNPTIREIATECNLSGATVHEHIRRLVRDGYIEMRPFAIRKYRVSMFGQRLV